MPGFHNPALAAIGAVAVGVSLAVSGDAPSSALRPAAEVKYDPAPVDPDPNVPNTSTTPKVSANTATEDAIATALKAAGVASPKRWAAEVVEYRPYPAGDPDLAKLRQNLAKYNPSQQTVDQIVSVLQP
jgi:hypothetical protein